MNTTPQSTAALNAAERAVIEAAREVGVLRAEAADPQPFWVTRRQAADRRLFAACDALVGVSGCSVDLEPAALRAASEWHDA